MRWEGPEEGHSGKTDGVTEAGVIRAAGTSNTIRRPDLNGSRVEGDKGEMEMRGDTAEAPPQLPCLCKGRCLLP